jgi:hypothetical protein
MGLFDIEVNVGGGGEEATATLATIGDFCGKEDDRFVCELGRSNFFSADFLRSSTV